MSLKLRVSQKGMTLIELMIAIVLAALVIGATIGFLVTTVKSSTENIRMTRMNQEMRVVMSFMLDELRRAGYTSDPTSPDMMNVLDWNSGNDCLSYAYLSNAASTAVGQNTMSFKHEGDSILFRDAGSASAVCGGVALNDSNVVRITNLTVSTLVDDDLVFSTAASVAIPTIKISIAGEIDNPPSSRVITDVVRLRNEAPQ